jgi:hypothetical protein
MREVTALYNIGVAVGSSLELKEVIKTLYKESSRLIDTSNFAIVIYDEHTKTLNFSLVYDQGKPAKPMSLKLSADRGLTGRVLTSQAPLLVPDFLKTNHLNKTNPGKIIRSWLAYLSLIPQRRDGGGYCHMGYEPNTFAITIWLLSAIGTSRHCHP